MDRETLKTLVDYDQSTGIFTWKKRPIEAFKNQLEKGWNKKHAGAPAGTMNALGYVRLSLPGGSVLAHRLAWLFVYGCYPSGLIDHINGNPSDNRIANLREADKQLNGENRRRPHRNNKSGFLGVYKNRTLDRWMAQITVDGKNRYIGSYKTPELAHEAYLSEKRKFHSGNTL